MGARKRPERALQERDAAGLTGPPRPAMIAVDTKVRSAFVSTNSGKGQRRGYQVYIGKFGDREVDFVATREREKLYVQVAYLLATPETIDREFGVLRQIPDNHPKLVLSLDTAFGEDIEGIRRLNLIDFLLEQGGPQ